MKVLGIDTSTESLGIAIAEDGKLLIGCDKIFGLRHSQDLIPTIKELLKSVSLTIDNIDGFAVAIGPGSFTGLRVGVTTAKALAIVKNKPVVGVPTLDVIAHNAYYYPGTICPIIDAKKGMLYAALYERKAKGLVRKSKYLLLTVEELLKKINKHTLFIGNGIIFYGKIIEKIKKEKAVLAPKRLWLPRSENVAMLGWEELKKGKTDNSFDIIPLYLHSRECNIGK
ncbi:MAG: tRNA (adenosine(37)-N6)-threonylcarbamoyltransferase complex dimerization subunit type 1 TsaB [Candidatus Omnitrophica bacterium CG07_land_8_20_14_0_80_42_15]|uniref:tRNA (Adenosine(37)-N6)-threonylcarbamoyltransferase complex dimerization subunit type 1 TsaB n=1 Tax=Candidatus Aquitaenariimonas noxiae TaxID=1974741 RepID=A0A2J0KXT9_9BACT|nr:MAG: tRNA (adenosine(37)-N6)-threonylcarbamoyltransferase complex dimerization subunit type 1 TsaB [Candidatus Omnitrophica bacterium CG07_land_8_20_14_0_80_42_15]